MKNFESLDIKYMKDALSEAKKSLLSEDVPIGAVIVCEDKIISRAYNQVEKKNDSTAHAEIIAIKRAVKKNGYKHLLNCTIYTTLEPCAMCAGAIVLARIKRLVFASFEPKSGASSSLFNITNDKRLNHRCQVTSGVLDLESSTLLKSFFKEIRAKRSQNNG